MDPFYHTGFGFDLHWQRVDIGFDYGAGFESATTLYASDAII